jgi:hypothetical protein
VPRGEQARQVTPARVHPSDDHDMSRRPPAVIIAVFLCPERPHSHVLRLGTIAHPRCDLSSHTNDPKTSRTGSTQTDAACESACQDIREDLHEHLGLRRIRLT